MGSQIGRRLVELTFEFQDELKREFTGDGSRISAGIASRRCSIFCDDVVERLDFILVHPDSRVAVKLTHVTWTSQEPCTARRLY